MIKMVHKLYFIGNVFNSDNEVAKYDDRGFAFSDREKRDVELVGLPIQIEHDEQLCVGSSVTLTAKASRGF